MNADKDLGSQQNQLASMQYDLRITNLARFLYSKVQRATCNAERAVIPSAVEGSLHVGRDDNDDMDPRVREDDPTSPSATQGRQTSTSYPLRASQPTLLDVGAGNGLFLKFFKSKGFKVSGYELEKELVSNMKKDPDLKGDFIKQGDITKMSGKEEYDVVIASDVIEHIEDDVAAIQGLWSFVEPGGILLITVPGHSYLYGKRDEMWGHFRRYDKDVLLDHIRSAISNSKFLISKQAPIFKIEFATQWNFVGFFVYGFYEKILHKSINEKMRYSDSLLSRIVRFVLDSILKFEEMIGGVPLGLTQVVGVRKAEDTSR